MNGFRDYYDRHFLWIELAACAVTSSCFVIYAELIWGRDGLVSVLKGSHQAAYSALVSVSISLLGFVLTAVSIILIFGQAPQFDLLRRSGQYPAVFRIFFQAITWLALAAVWSFVGLLADTDTSPAIFVTYGTLFLALVVIARVCRCIWILRKIAAIATSTLPSPTNAPATSHSP